MMFAHRSTLFYDFYFVENFPAMFAMSWDGVFKLLRSPGIDSKEQIPPAYVAWQAGTSTTTPFLIGSYPP